MTMTDDQALAVLRLIFENRSLKDTPRKGWLTAGVSLAEVETVAEHSHETAVIAFVLAALEGGDPYRAAGIAVLHDMQETRTTDFDYVVRQYVTKASDEAVAADQVEGVPSPVAEALLGVVAEHSGGSTLEAQCAIDADRLSCLVQGVWYRRQGHRDAQELIDNMARAVKTPSGKVLAEAALRNGDRAVAWWKLITAKSAAAIL